MNKSSKYLLISLITFIVGYLFLRFAYINAENIPFAQEIILIVLGTIATIAITAALLNKQSEVEIEKEQRVKIFDLKSNLYFKLIEFIEKIILKGEITEKDLVALEFLTHKISIIASPEVLKGYSNFIKVIKNTAKDSKITHLESDELSSSLAKLCGKIRYDLILKDPKSNINIEEIIKDNIDKL
ncbi:hypothetical protein Lupro_03130 [Lutibacter profundi]|uniref:Uncharacterized protein n=1 Tax=Lutibacter profundi TaxID=1622118 RepID=A0A0X8G588_9FLAO|nr:hypothetical protein [Lutibacter profundi]AMC10307.1 hypothetical protein Lupro_03130 [Lutibacter profundi]